VPRKKKPAAPRLHSPQPITDAHDLSQFNSGEPALDDWLRRRALKNEACGASRTFVVSSGTKKQVAAYYCLAAGAVAHAAVAGRVRRNMPDPVPVMVIGRLVVDQNFQSHGLGRGMLRDAILRTMQAADIAGIRAVLVHAISDEARKFYDRCGFRPSAIDPMTLMITLAEAKSALAGSK
jgi:GNAT superfamily N-acetyltransferase